MFQTPRRSTLPLVFLLVCATSSAAAQDAQKSSESESVAAPDASDAMNPMEAALAAKAKKEQATPTSFSLEKLIELAVENKALLAEFRAKRASAEWDKYRAEHITWMPTIESTTLLSVVPDNANPDAFNRNIDQIADLDIGPYVREDLNLIVPLYTFGKSDAAAGLAQLGIENAGLELENAQLDSIVQIQKAYWGARLSLAFQQMLDEGAEMIGAQLQVMQDKRDFGDVDFDMKDFRKLELFDAEIQSRIVDNKKLGNLARLGLHFLTDIPDATEIQLAAMQDLDSPPQLKKRPYYVERALGHRPELQQLDRAVQARQFQADLATSNWYPDLFAALRFTFSWSTVDTAYQQICTANSLDAATDCEFPRDQAVVDGEPLFARPYGDSLHTLSLQLGVGLRWKIEPFQLYAKSQKADSQVQIVQAQQERARKAVSFEISTLYQKASDELAKLAINRKRLKAAERWRNQFGLSKQTAGADLKDAVEPLKAYFEARAKYLQTIYDYQIARAELARGVGARALDAQGEVVDD